MGKKHKLLINSILHYFYSTIREASYKPNLFSFLVFVGSTDTFAHDCGHSASEDFKVIKRWDSDAWFIVSP